MKNLLITTIFLLSILGSGLAQVNFVVDQSKFVLQDISQETISHSNIYNTSATDTLYLMWERDIYGYDLRWDISICDQNQCYATSDRSNGNQPLIIPPGGQSILDIRVNPKRNYGNAEVEISLFNMRTQELVGQHLVNFSADQSIATSKGAPEIMLYPNPTQDIFYLKNDTKVERISIFNIVGKEINSFSHMPGASYDIMNMSKGLYIVRLFDANNKSLKVMRLQKK